MSDFAVATFAAFCIGLFLWRLATTTSRSRRVHAYVAKPLMTANEREFFARLVSAHGEGYVFAQVAMSGLLEPKARGAGSHLADFRRISQKRIDYTLHNRDLSLLCVVELDDPTHESWSNKRRDRERDDVLRAAGIKTLRFASSGKPSISQLRSVIAATGMACSDRV